MYNFLYLFNLIINTKVLNKEHAYVLTFYATWCTIVDSKFKNKNTYINNQITLSFALKADRAVSQSQRTGKRYSFLMSGFVTTGSYTTRVRPSWYFFGNQSTIVTILWENQPLFLVWLQQSYFSYLLVLTRRNCHRGCLSCHLYYYFQQSGRLAFLTLEVMAYRA